jgi:hypothetical protein
MKLVNVYEVSSTRPGVRKLRATVWMTDGGKVHCEIEDVPNDAA